jgi:mRNA-degrading endonuclease RelE of RelBE toxin-antitoxin system
MDFEDDFHDRSVDYTRSARADIKILSNQFKRFDKEFLQGIHTFLRVSAHRGIPVYGSIYLYKTQKRPDTPPFRVLYTFDNRKVLVRKISVVPKEEES